MLDSLNAVLPVHITYHPLALPIGISFYTFQILSYIIDVYREMLKFRKNIPELCIICNNVSAAYRRTDRTVCRC